MMMYINMMIAMMMMMMMLSMRMMMTMSIIIYSISFMTINIASIVSIKEETTSAIE
jgi:hypothetical protein